MNANESFFRSVLALLILEYDKFLTSIKHSQCEEVSSHCFTISDKLEDEAIVIGRSTVQEYFLPNSFDYENGEPTAERDAFVGKRDGNSTIIIIDPKGKVLFDAHKDESFITIISEQVSDKHLQHLRDNNISYILGGKDGKDTTKAMDVLGEKFGFKKILLEGGGYINGEFLNAELIDELSIIMYPGIDGLSGIPPPFFVYKAY
ncbi:MAG: dihydrofolate reductase family protein [Bacteroidales bacterium]